ncbi:MAG: type II toxin-antitoxin system VapC family toxin [Terracidiphilus sp.]
MRLLLDTHILLWLMADSPKLKPRARLLIEGAQEVYVSSASILEIAIKHRLGKIEGDPEEIVARIEETGLKELPVVSGHAVACGRLPLLHHDPFDRLLLGQAIFEPMQFLTADAKLAAYSGLVIAV